MAGREAWSGLAATPRRNRDLAQIRGEFATLTEALDYAAQGETGFNFYSSRGELETVLPYSQLRELALDMGRRLLAHGLKRGDRVAVLAETSPDFLGVFFGCQYAGLIPCPVPYSMYVGGKEAYVQRIAGMLKSAEAAAIIAPDSLESHVQMAGERAGTGIVRTFDQLAGGPQWRGELVAFAANDPAYIQYSSGSTSDPKGVLITQRAITANARGGLVRMQVRADDRGFSWLPLYHDMGLVGFCIMPMLAQASVDYLATTAFARRPALWLKLMSDNRSTITYSPSFGYELAGHRINGDAVKLDLSHLRVAGIGGDMVRPEVLELFATRLAPAKFDPNAFLPSYGMAESTLVVTIRELEEPVKVDIVERAQCKLWRRAVPASQRARFNPEKTCRFVVCGRPLPDHELKVVDEDGRVLGDREIGRILVKGPSLMAGYFGNAEATRAVMRDDGFMDTGDMGYLVGNEIVITGRAKDLILHNGRNIWPQDIEWTVERVPSVRGGDAAAIAIETPSGEDRLVILLQCRLTGRKEMENLRRAVLAAVHRSAGVDCEVVLIAPRSLPFTSSGKLSRAAAKTRYLAGDIAEIGMTVSAYYDRPRVAAAS
jgi:fatty-acyl-CoA synthase